ncbi:MAG: hypothetical protein ACR2O0_00990 [Rhizobiaceae bacterium]
MRNWRWRTKAMASIAGIVVLVISLLMIRLGAGAFGAPSSWQILNIPLRDLISTIVLPAILAGVVWVYAIRQETTDRRYDERRNR